MITQAIVTRYLGAAGKRGPRIKATAEAGSVILGYEHELSADKNHSAAARALATKFGWHGRWYGGGLPGNKGNVYVCAPFGGSDGAAFTIKPAKVRP